MLPGQMTRSVQSDNRLAGPCRASHSSGPLELSFDHIALLGMKEDGPFLPREIERQFQLIQILYNAETTLSIGMRERVFFYSHGSGNHRCIPGRQLKESLCRLRREVITNSQQPIFVGGTGLYFQALTQGMAEIPDITEPARAEARGMLDELGAAGLHAALGERDPVMAQRLKPTDSQRLVRAYEVIESTGVSLADWQQRPSSTPTLPLPWRSFVLNWPRTELYRRCDERLAAMLEQGALDEVAKLAAMNLDPALPAMKALGVPELIRLSRGEISREAALSAAQQATRRYAKRQMTWFRNKMCAWNGLDAQDSERLSEIIIPFIT